MGSGFFAGSSAVAARDTLAARAIIRLRMAVMAVPLVRDGKGVSDHIWEGKARRIAVVKAMGKGYDPKRRGITRKAGAP
jgi:hypothetical protein